MKRERDIEEWMRKKIERLGGVFMKWVSPGNDGVPDRIVILPGGAVYFIELKRNGEAPTELQKWQIKRLKKLGCHATVITGMREARLFIEEVMPDEVHTTRLSEESHRACD